MVGILLIVNCLFLFIPLLVTVAIFTLFESKVLASIQRRNGPNNVGVLGLLQPFADGLNLLTNEFILPARIINNFMFLGAPLLLFFLSLLTWTIVPFAYRSSLVDLNIGILFILAIFGFNIYGVLAAGWSSNSRYAFLGALRSAAQMLSYELNMGIILVIIVNYTGSLNLFDLVDNQSRLYNIWPHFPLFVMFLLCVLAESNRTPFDLVEAESELVSGFHVEYGAVGFTLIFLAEYSSLLLWSHMIVLLFLGGWLPPYTIRVLFWQYFNISVLAYIPFCWWYAVNFIWVLGLLVWISGTVGRLRYDQLMSFGWNYALPLTLGWIPFSLFLHNLFMYFI